MTPLSANTNLAATVRRVHQGRKDVLPLIGVVKYPFGRCSPEAGLNISSTCTLKHLCALADCSCSFFPGATVAVDHSAKYHRVVVPESSCYSPTYSIAPGCVGLNIL